MCEAKLWTLEEIAIVLGLHLTLIGCVPKSPSEAVSCQVILALLQEDRVARGLTNVRFQSCQKSYTSSHRHIVDL